MTTHDGDSTQSSRARLLNAGKMLFARNGYEKTSTSAIAREAGSSESQLIRYFGGKAGLLETIFNESWAPLTAVIEQHVSDAAHGREAIVRILSVMIRAFSQDHDMAFLFLLEGRRVRGVTHDVVLSEGFIRFVKVIDALIERGRRDGSFRTDIEPRVLCPAILGCAEGMIRDKVLAQRNNEPDVFSQEAIEQTFEAMVGGLAP